jgi:hypothetical protein
MGSVVTQSPVSSAPVSQLRGTRPSGVTARRSESSATGSRTRVGWRSKGGRLGSSVHRAEMSGTQRCSQHWLAKRGAIRAILAPHSARAPPFTSYGTTARTVWTWINTRGYTAAMSTALLARLSLSANQKTGEGRYTIMTRNTISRDRGTYGIIANVSLNAGASS